MKKLSILLLCAVITGCAMGEDIASRISIDVEKPATKKSALFPVTATYENATDENMVWVDKHSLQPVLKAGASTKLNDGVNAYVLYNKDGNACGVVNLDSTVISNMTRNDLKKLVKQNCKR